jgi:hypothetical protein
VLRAGHGAIAAPSRRTAGIEPCRDIARDWRVNSFLRGDSLLKTRREPCTVRYKEELDPEHIPQFGLIAEEVEKVNPDLVVRDDDGKPMTVRYEAEGFNARTAID